MMKHCSAYLLSVVALAACSENKGVRVQNEEQVAAVQSRARSEPIFYNGKTYQFELAPDGAGNFALAVGGMSAKQQKDAVNVATSSLRYYACPEGQTGTLTGAPSYADGKWRMTGACTAG
jgi:hypothetical protein